jgi:pimeloyl-ACP methyl ester carboxylesterase
MNCCAEQTGEKLRLRIHGDASLPTLIYLPGTHGDWTLVTSFRLALAGRVRFVEFTYPRTLSWSLEEYARAIEAALLAHGITQGWILGESFGSQIVWPLAESVNREARGAKEHSAHFTPLGIILAGGFGRHPFKWGVRLAATFCHGVSLRWLTRLLFFYARFARFRHRQAPETLASIREFVARRTELDKQAAVHRLRLIADHDPQPIAAQTTLPVYYLSGLFEPIVPWMFVAPWLRRHCPGYRGRRIIRKADHNVLGTAPRESAEQVVAWLKLNP